MEREGRARYVAPIRSFFRVFGATLALPVDRPDALSKSLLDAVLELHRRKLWQSNGGDALFSVLLSDSARAEVLRRFAELNRQHYEGGQAAMPTVKPRTSEGRAKAGHASQGALALGVSSAPAAITAKTTAAASAKKASPQRTSN